MSDRCETYSKRYIYKLFSTMSNYKRHLSAEKIHLFVLLSPMQISQSIDDVEPSSTKRNTDFPCLSQFSREMFRLICTRFIICSSRTTTYLSQTQLHCFSKSSVSSNENAIVSAMILGNVSKQDFTDMHFPCNIHRYLIQNWLYLEEILYLFNSR